MSWYKNFNLKTKVFFLVTVVAVVSFLAVTVIVSTHSIAMAKSNAFNLAEKMAEKYKNEIKAELQGARVTSETLASVFDTLKAHGLTNRDMMNDILRNALVKKEYITAFCIAYDPDALDGKDAEYAGQRPAYNETGRYSLYWNKLGGNIEVEPLYNIDRAGWYIIPRETMAEYITDPYPYRVQGNDVMLASFVFPLSYEGKFIGIIASDIVLDELQSIVSQVNTQGKSEYSEIFSNSGIVVAHPDKTRLGKDIRELLEGGAENEYEAIREGRQYTSTSGGFYSVYMPIRFSDSTNPWSVAVHFPMGEILQAADEIRNFVIGVSIISITVIALLLYIISRGITKPILALAQTAKTLGEGNFHAQVPVVDSGDEIGVLSRAFKMMTENLIAAKEQAEEGSRAKSDFLSNMSHEMRTPLNAIIGMTTIGKAARDMEKKDYSFGKIEDASTHMLEVVNDILDMSKIEANKMELSLLDFDFEKMIRKVVNVINFRVDEKRQNFHVSIDNKIPRRIVGDDQRLSQVITNLLSNSVKFTPEGGSLRLDARLIDEENGLCTIRFDVTDTGIGIRTDQQARLFTSFQQADSSTSRKYGGTGLGLAISKRIVEMMNGTILLKSEFGKGSTFTFTIQVERGKTERRSLLDPGVNWENIKVLAVDDDPQILECFRGIAEGLGITHDTVSSGSEAVTALNQGKEHDIYFVDWRMPGINGIELTKKIKECSAGKSVVTMISSTEWSVIADEAKAAGVDRFLPKPLFSSDIADCINECLGLHSDTADTDPVETENQQAMFPGRRILLVEDVEINREIVLSLLDPTELEIDCAGNGAEALRIFSENPQKYDMIFMDVQMPEMDGMEATRCIRALEKEWDSPKNIPIIAMTANVFREDVEKCRAAGMNDHLGKPLDIDAVLGKLRSYL